jgi:hypothetical protein
MRILGRLTNPHEGGNSGNSPGFPGFLGGNRRAPKSNQLPVDFPGFPGELPVLPLVRVFVKFSKMKTPMTPRSTGSDHYRRQS